MATGASWKPAIPGDAHAPLIVYYTRMEMMPAILSQQSYRCHLDWGGDGVRRAAARRDVVVVVDVLRFSTAVVTAVQRGALVYPCSPSADSAALARRVGAKVAASRPDMAETQRYSLSPGSYDDVPPGTRVKLPSPNGAVCSRFGRRRRTWEETSDLAG